MTHHRTTSMDGPALRRRVLGWSLACILITLAGAHADERRRGDEPRGFPFSSEERWHGSRAWKPDRSLRRTWPWPDRFTVDRPGNCEVRCVRSGREYRCREYRC
jgi:hypothetical protein